MGKHYIVDENGVVKDILESSNSYVILSDGDRVLRKNSIEYLENTVDIKFDFVKLNSSLTDNFYSKYPILLTLIQYTEYMTNILTYRNGRIVKVGDIPKICNISKSTARRHLNKMIEDDIIHKIKIEGKTGLILNPFICYKGKRISLKTYEEFKNSVYAEYCEIKVVKK